MYASSKLNRGEKRSSGDAAGFLQSVRQSLFDFFPVGFGEVGLEFEQSRNVSVTVSERTEAAVKNQHFNQNNLTLKTAELNR